ncbi:MAG: hypothetical protein H6517_08080 [Microthrixaceae bacterium]|nr:hypothetical protein [Microthrixaceae bacterium]MCB9387767.1 hypothetical protein [Microthrixaceae bacterium]MCO5319773.1 hypothetical protein [Microthrixaceae bacterium]
MLLVLDDTSSGRRSDTAVHLHRGLVAHGAEVRSVALAPGGDGALDEAVPVLAPAPRSLAAMLQLRREQRWADLVVCAGDVAALLQRMTGPRRRASVQLVWSSPGNAGVTGRTFRHTDPLDAATLSSEELAEQVLAAAEAAR